MKITLSQLRNIIKETLEVHQVPVDLDTVDSEEAYGIGYMKGKEPQCDHPDWAPSCTKNDSASAPDLSAKFAKEAEAKSAALSATAHFSDALQIGGDHIPDDILSNIYTSLLGLARDAKK